MATSLYKAQSVLRLCEIHDEKELHAYCRTCKIEICSSCIKEDHTSHDWETITDIHVLREKRRSLPEECREIRSKQLTRLKRELRQFDRKIEEANVRFIQNKSALNGSRESFINEINRLFDYRVNECEQKSEEAIQPYKEKREGLKQTLEYLDMMTISLDKDISTLPDHDILGMEQEMRDKLEVALSYIEDKYSCTTMVVPGQIDVKVLETMIGEIHNVAMEETNDEDIYSYPIVSLKPVTDTNAWVRINNDNYGRLIDSAGEVLQTMNTSCTDLTLSKSGELILSSIQERNISVLTKDEEIITTIDIKPLKPTFINNADNNDILVTMVDDGDLYNLVPTSRRVVQCMTLTGKVLHTYEFMEDGKTRLLTCPMRTAENHNTDICIVNRICRGIGELVVLHKDGTVKFIYKGIGPDYAKFVPRDVECDAKCRILFSEINNSAIYMLSAEGIYLCTLCQYKNLHPGSISIQGNNLWCGFYEGRVKVDKYTN